MKPIISFIAGFLTAAAIIGLGLFLSYRYAIPRQFPEQISFDHRDWREGDAVVRGQMHKAAVAVLESERPSKDEVLDILGPSGVSKANMNAVDHYLIYQIDFGQRLAGMPFLNRLGVAFHEDGSYSHTTTWD